MNVQCGAQQTYVAKGKLVPILGFVDHMISVAPAHLYPVA